jgi:anti-sigma B factor antagonist
MTNPNPIITGPTEHGLRLALEGRGTLLESPAVRELVEHVLADPTARVIIDLSRCTYVDSTFLGMLVGLHKRYGAPPSRYAIAASPETRRALFSVSRLDSVLCFVPAAPEYSGQTSTLAASPAAGEALGRHVLESHRALAQLGGAEAEGFRGVAEALAAELDGPGNSADG